MTPKHWDSEDEIVDILLFVTTKSSQRDMDHQGFDDLSKTPQEVVLAFMKHIKILENFHGDKKAAKANNS